MNCVAPNRTSHFPERREIMQRWADYLERVEGRGRSNPASWQCGVRKQQDRALTTICADLFRIMAFSQLTWRESLRDIEVCLAANQTKLFHMGLKGSPARSTLADALNLRDWRIYHALAQRLIARARSLYANEPGIPELDASVYALDATTIDLCLRRRRYGVDCIVLRGEAA